MSLYKVIFLGLTVAGSEEEVRLIKGLQMKFNLSPEKAESLLQRVPIVVKKGASKEEMERYVKAFGEIGGRIRVEEEEEPIMELPEITRAQAPPPEPPNKTGRAYERGPETKPPMVTCPQCGFEQPETDECIKCRVTISKYLQYQEMARLYEGKVREISSGEGETPPWESGEGFIRAFFRTTQEALFSPVRFFKKVGSGTGYWISLIYGLICGAIADYTNVFWIWLFFSIFFQFLPPQFSYAISFFSGVVIIILLISLPMFEAFTILLASGITHLCLILVGGNKKGFEATFRTFSYANSARLFYIIPFFIIPFFAPILIFALTLYHLILIIIGIRECNGISTGKAVLAVLLPLIILIGLGILGAILSPLFFRMMGFSRGVSV